MHKLKILLITIFVVFPSFNCFSNDNFKEIVNSRMAKFQESKSLMRNINKNLSNKNFIEIEKSSKKLNLWSNEMDKFFPRGSEASSLNKSEASNDIWSDPKGFKIAINSFKKKSAQLIKIAASKDLDKTVSAFRELAGTCKGCHQKYRN